MEEKKENKVSEVKDVAKEELATTNNHIGELNSNYSEIPYCSIEIRDNVGEVVTLVGRGWTSNEAALLLDHAISRLKQVKDVVKSGV